MKARCQCGKVAFTTPTPTPVQIYICHCTECRHQSSSAFGISAMFPEFELPEQALQHIGVYRRHTLKGKDMKCYFCKTCGSRIMHDRGTGTVSVKGGCLEGLTKEMLAGATHIWTKFAVVDIPAGVENFEGEPPEY